MKKIFLVVALIATAWIKSGFAQNSQTQSLLTSYYDIKNALVNSNAKLAVSKASDFSTNLFKLSKAVELIKEPVYYGYFPMNKSYWLSDKAAIKNPYFGKQMLTCGQLRKL
jgi:hypothetical protein